jgi:hypothetical protein
LVCVVVFDVPTRLSKPEIDCERMVPLISDEYCQKNMPVHHLLNLYAATKAALKVCVVIYPVLDASTVVAGLPTTILLPEMPLAII